MSQPSFRATPITPRVVLVVVIALMVALIVLVGLIQVFFPPVDPGQGIFEVRLVNDTVNEVVIQRHCAVEQPPCEFTNYRDIAPGASAFVATADGDQDQHYRVITPQGIVVGCLPLRFRTVQQGATVMLSRALAPC